MNASYNGSGILKSSDGGNTWIQQGAATFTGACFYRMAVHPTDPNTTFAASNLGLYRTTDGGANWLPITSGLPAISATVLACTDFTFEPVTPDTAYVAFWGDGIYKTTSAMAATPVWTKLAGGLPATDLSRIAIALSPTAPQNVYALMANASDGLKGFFVSPDGGELELGAGGWRHRFWSLHAQCRGRWVHTRRGVLVRPVAVQGRPDDGQLDRHPDRREHSRR